MSPAKTTEELKEAWELLPPRTQEGSAGGSVGCLTVPHRTRWVRGASSRGHCSSNDSEAGAAEQQGPRVVVVAAVAVVVVYDDTQCSVGFLLASLA